MGGVGTAPTHASRAGKDDRLEAPEECASALSVLEVSQTYVTGKQDRMPKEMPSHWPNDFSAKNNEWLTVVVCKLKTATWQTERIHSAETRVRK
jgi:hypothetical protein